MEIDKKKFYSKLSIILRNNICHPTQPQLFNCSLRLNHRGNVDRFFLSFLDVDECVHGSHDCLPSLASCSNTVGSYNCTCNYGYVGDGKTFCRPKGKYIFIIIQCLKWFCDGFKLTLVLGLVVVSI